MKYVISLPICSDSSCFLGSLRKYRQVQKWAPIFFATGFTRGQNNIDDDNNVQVYDLRLSTFTVTLASALDE